MKIHWDFFSSTLLLLLFISTSCTRMIYSMYGLNTTEVKTDEEIISNARKYGITSNQLFEVDQNYKTFLHEADTISHKEARKNHLQPLQALYYDSLGQLQSFFINCYTRGFPNLKWNENGALNTFPPGQQAPLDTIIALTEHLNLLQPIHSDAIVKPLSISKNTILVYWSSTMGRQSKRFIRKIQHNLLLADSSGIQVYYIHSDELLK